MHICDSCNPGYKGAQLLGTQFAVDAIVTLEIIHRISGISLMSPQVFRDFELALVRLYRADERAQEGIAIALTRANLSEMDVETRARLDEVFAMLQHVHDPLITSCAEEEDEFAQIAACL